MEERKLSAGEAPAGDRPLPSGGICPNCGAKPAYGDLYCPVCGQARPEQGWPGSGAVERAPRPAPPPPRAPFSADWREITAAVLMFVLAWWYLYRSDLFLAGVFGLDNSTETQLAWGTLIFVLGFIGLVELLHWERQRSRESWVWLGCMLVIALGVALGRNQVWEELAQFALHLIAVWWVLSRSGRLAEERSGHLFPLDGANGLFVIPFRYFILRARTLWYGLTRLRRGRLRVKTATLLWSGLALLAALLLFILAAALLMNADEGFEKLMSGLTDWLRFDWDPVHIVRFILSLPVGAYLFGLIAGVRRVEPETMQRRGRIFAGGLEKLRKIPNRVWSLLTGAFVLLYLVFFAVQSRYLFGAFTRTLPEGFIVSEYARQGFFELCMVMGVNFVLLWLVTRMSRRPVRENRPALVLCLILLAESLLFAVVAFSKLALYIDCFGFTPLRLQSSWLVCVLFAGCLAFGWNLLTEKRTFRAWLIFSAVSMSLLCLY